MGLMMVVSAGMMKSVLPYFKKSENFEGGANRYRGVGGPLNVSLIRNPNPISTAAIEAAVQIGFSRNDDYNGADQLGVGYCQLTIKDGKRHSPAAAFLTPVSSRPNLKVLTGAAVQKLLFKWRSLYRRGLRSRRRTIDGLL